MKVVNRVVGWMADFLLENGATLVLDGHVHVPQPTELCTVFGTDEALL